MKKIYRMVPGAGDRVFALLFLCAAMTSILPAAACALPLLFSGEGSGQTTSRTGEKAVLDSTSTLEDYVSYAIENNPLIKAYDDFRTATRSLPPVKRSLPDPMLSFGYFARSVETRLGPQENSWMLSQKFPFFGKLSLRGDIAEKDADIADKSYEENVLDLVKSVKETYYDYFRVYHVTKIMKDEKWVLRRMQDVAQIKYASGLVSQQDVLKAQLALSKVDDMLTLLERELTTVRTRLNRLLNRAPLAPLASPRADFSNIDLKEIDQIYKLAEKKRPELQSADIAIEKALKARDLARKEYFPDLTLSMQYVSVGERPMVTLPENGKDAVLLKASVNIPIWFNKLGAGVKEAEARLSLARHRKESIQTSIRSEVQDTYTKVRTGRELVTLYRNVIIPQAEQTFHASEAGYQTGEVDFLNYLDSERTLLALRRAYYTVLADLGKQLAHFERSVGMDLDELRK